MLFILGMRRKSKSPQGLVERYSDCLNKYKVTVVQSEECIPGWVHTLSVLEGADGRAHRHGLC